MKGDSMKRFICVLLILCLVPAFVVAESVELSAEYFNVYASEMGLPELPKEYTTQIEENGNERRTYDISESIKYMQFVKDNDVYMCGVVALSADSYLDFLAYCLCGAFSVDPSGSLYVGVDLIQDFCMVRSGKGDQKSNAVNGIYEVSSIGGEKISFLYVKVNQ